MPATHSLATAPKTAAHALAPHLSDDEIDQLLRKPASPEWQSVLNRALETERIQAENENLRLKNAGLGQCFSLAIDGWQNASTSERASAGAVVKAPSPSKRGGTDPSKWRSTAQMQLLRVMLKTQHAVHQKQIEREVGKDTGVKPASLRKPIANLIKNVWAVRGQRGICLTENGVRWAKEKVR
jgi:hypothetical protein